MVHLYSYEYNIKTTCIFYGESAKLSHSRAQFFHSSQQGYTTRVAPAQFKEIVDRGRTRGITPRSKTLVSQVSYDSVPCIPIRKRSSALPRASNTHTRTHTPKRKNCVMDTEYLKLTVGDALTRGCAATATVRPADSVEYLAEWLHQCVPSPSRSPV